MKIRMALKPCPWCRMTPDIWMPIEEKTWMWHIHCINPECHIKPKSPHISIRKSTKSDFFAFHDKLEHLAYMWNESNPFKAYEAKEIDLEVLPDLNRSAESLCSRDAWFQTIEAI